MLTLLEKVWDIQTRTIKHTFSGHEQDIYSLDFARNGRHIASGSGDRTVRMWDIESGQQTLILSIEDGVTTVAISPDGQFVAAGSLDKSVRVWDARSGYLVERLDGNEGHRDSVYSVAFAPNGRDLVSGSLDKTIKMWELPPPKGMLPGPGPKGGKCVRTFEGHKVDYARIFSAGAHANGFGLGFCSQCCSHTGRCLGHEWLQRPRGAVLGPANRSHTINAPGPQKLRYVLSRADLWSAAPTPSGGMSLACRNNG